MKNFEEKRRLAWEEFISHSIEPPNPATVLAYQSLFYAGFGAGYDSASAPDYDCNHRYIQSICIDCGGSD